MKTLSYGDCRRITQAIGLSLGQYDGPDDDSRGLGFTIGGGKLTNGREAEDWIANMNGWSVEEIAREAIKRNAVQKFGRWGWRWIKAAGSKSRETCPADPPSSP